MTVKKTTKKTTKKTNNEKTIASEFRQWVLAMSADIEFGTRGKGQAITVNTVANGGSRIAYVVNLLKASDKFAFKLQHSHHKTLSILNPANNRIVATIQANTKGDSLKTGFWVFLNAMGTKAEKQQAHRDTVYKLLGFTDQPMNDALQVAHTGHLQAFGAFEPEQVQACLEYLKPLTEKTGNKQPSV